MRKSKRNGGFRFSLLINLALNLDGTIPAWIMLALHFLFDLPLWLFIGALALWAANIIIRTLILCWASSGASSPPPVKENKNPYSANKKPRSNK